MLSLAVADAALADDPAPPAAFTSRELRDRLAGLDARVRCWSVEYETEPEDTPGGARGAYVHRTVAVARPGRLFMLSAKGAAGRPWQEDPFRQRLRVRDGVAVSEMPASRVFRCDPLTPGGSLPGSATGEFLFAALGWWPLETMPAAERGGPAPSIRGIARSDAYAVRPRQERVAGRWCHVLERPGRDRLWLDAERGCATVARELLDESGATLQRIELTGHREVSHGVWLPTRMRNIVFGAPGIAGIPGTPGASGLTIVRTDANVRVIAAHANEPLPDELFEFRPEPGAIRLLGDGRFEQAVPGGEDQLDRAASWIERYGRRPGEAPPAWSGEAVMECIVSAVCLAVLALLRVRDRPLVKGSATRPARGSLAEATEA